VLIDLTKRGVVFIPMLKPMLNLIALACTQIAPFRMIEYMLQNIKLSLRVPTTYFRSGLLQVIIGENSCISIPNP
jgi:hypothetical protein